MPFQYKVSEDKKSVSLLTRMLPVRQTTHLQLPTR